MADPEHLKILHQGVNIWNRWRKDNPNLWLNLSDADLYGANLKGYNLREVSLWRCRLERANLREADLQEANLNAADLTDANLLKANLLKANIKYANLMNADLSHANLSQANLSYSRLMEINLSEAYLRGANFTGASLRDANLTKADLRDAYLTRTIFWRTNLTYTTIGHTTFGSNNLSNSIGLETIEHEFPSTIGIDTIRLSKGNIPTEFLRGCGLSDVEIEFAKLANPDLTEKEITDITYKIHEFYTSGIAIQYYSVFISYSFKDQEFAQMLHDKLQNNGIRCWFAPHDIQGGKKISEQLDEAIKIYDRLLLILSENSMSSEWVKTEIANARQKEINEKRQVLFPISIVDYQKIREWKNFDADTGKDSAREIREYFIPDFSNWHDKAAYQTAFQRLLRDLKSQ